MKEKKIKFTFKLIILLLTTVISIFPFYALFMMATRYSEDIFKGLRFMLTPGNYFFKNIETAMQFNFVRSFFNSFTVSFFSATIGTFTSAIAGFAFAKYRFRFRNAMFMFILVTMMIPGQMGLIGYVVEMRKLHLNTTIVPLILTNTASAFGVFFMTQYIQGALPNEIIESARIDGCGEFNIFFRILVPCCVPGLLTIYMLLFIWSWNSYMLPLVMAGKPENYTVPIAVSTIGTLWRIDYGARLAALALSIIPVLLLLSFGSKYFIKGLTAGAVKE